MARAVARRTELIDSIVTSAYYQLREHGSWVRLNDIRWYAVLATSRWDRITKDEIDASLARLAAAGHARFAPMRSPARVDRKAGVQVGGQKCHLIAIGTRHRAA